MKALTACLYCNKKKECPGSVKAHSFTDSCFKAEDEGIRAAIDDLRSLLKLCPNIEAAEKINGVAETLLEYPKKMKKLAQMLITDACASVCLHGGPCIYENAPNPKECFDCESPCVCYDCFDGKNFKIDWSKLNET